MWIHYMLSKVLAHPYLLYTGSEFKNLKVLITILHVDFMNEYLGIWIANFWLGELSAEIFSFLAFARSN